MATCFTKSEVGKATGYKFDNNVNFKQILHDWDIQNVQIVKPSP
jgi:hypothetical protein